MMNSAAKLELTPADVPGRARRGSGEIVRALLSPGLAEAWDSPALQGAQQSCALLPSHPPSFSLEHLK